MKRFLIVAGIASCVALPLGAEPGNPKKTTLTENTVEFESDEKLEPGFLTSMLNKAIEKKWEGDETHEEKPKLGEKLTGFASAPKFGGFFV